MSVFQEFKKFALRGNVIDMAVGIIIGAAFGVVALIGWTFEYYTGDDAV